jgi:uncharacterized damage-inducible protein DinB
MSKETQINALLIQDIKKRLFQESVPRIVKCLGLLADDQIWKHPNEHSNSIGNLVLHLNGNVRQWVLSGIFGEKDERDRDAEFSFEGPTPKKNLIELLDRLREETMEALDKISSEMLVEERKVQGFNETVISILVHVTEHFSYHTGQIAFYTKILLDTDLGFYSDYDLNIKTP